MPTPNASLLDLLGELGLLGEESAFQAAGVDGASPGERRLISTLLKHLASKKAADAATKALDPAAVEESEASTTPDKPKLASPGGSGKKPAWAMKKRIGL